MRILIVGAGIGGLAAAQGLLADGHHVTVFEQAPALPAGGAAVTIGLTLVGAGRRIHTLEARGSTGRSLAVLDVTTLAGRSGTPAVTLPRRLLLDRLSADLPSGAVRLGARCAGVSTVDGKARARFANGSVAEGDVLIGADGRHSTVRAALSLEGPADPTGWATWQGLSPIPIELTAGRLAVTITGPEGGCGLMPAGEGLLHWWFNVPWTPDGVPPSSPVAELRRRFGGWQDPVPQVLAAVSDEDVELFPHHRYQIHDDWGRGLCTLLGDSVPAMPSLLAQGPSQALEDAWLLVRSLRTTPADAPRALRDYEQARRRRVAVGSWPAAPGLQESSQPVGQVPPSAHSAFATAIGHCSAT
jgi:FAD-dependent urate hydroxylase